MGSLCCALLSYLDARTNNGQWLVRIEDIDPPREQAGASEAILDSLTAHGLHWDAEPVFQSHRSAVYEQALARLEDAGLTYRCRCSRNTLAALGLGAPYPGTCRKLAISANEPHAIRVRVQDTAIEFNDRWQGAQQEVLADTVGDFVIRRKDGLFAYQLAVSVDDAAQGINEVVRGVDLLDSTARQLYLVGLLDGSPPNYSHHPVLVDQQGHKLAKQTGAVALDNRQATHNLLKALDYLGQATPPTAAGLTVPAVLQFAMANYQPQVLRARAEIQV